MDTISWKWFRYEELFDIKKGKRLTKADMIEGNIPYIGAIDSNNGVSAYIANDAHIHKGKTISVSYNGSIGYAYYQEKEFWATDDVNVLYPRFKMNRYLALFLCSLIEKEQYRFNYGRKWDLNSMKASRIKLPVAPTGEPDWLFMEEYIKSNIIPQLPQKSQRVWLKNFDITPQKEDKKNIHTENWKWFKIKDFCQHPYKALAYNALDLTECDEDDPKSIRYITRTDANNGCKCCVINDNFEKVEKENAITIGDTTSTIYYQNKPFICGDHMVVLRSEHFNLYTGLFITALLNKERFRYNYGRAFKKDIIYNTRIKLPVTLTGDPDWQFMEDYIKSLPYSKNIEPTNPQEQIRALQLKLALTEHQLLEKEKQTVVNNIHIYESGAVHDDNSTNISLNPGK